MIIGNAKLFLDGVFVPGSVQFENGIITVIGPVNMPCDLDAQEKYLIPGFIDIHTHGAMGGDASDGNMDALFAMAHYHLRHGVTTFLPTTMTLPENVLVQVMHTIRDFSRPSDGARIAGIHLEGPFLSHAKRGAQNPVFLRKPDFDMLCRLYDESGGQIVLTTIAPEEDAEFDFIQRASALCAISLGHTAADYDMIMAAFAAGASHVTHLLNAMPGLENRSPGVLGAALDSGASVEVICDGVHIHESIIRMIYKLFGEKMVMISDSLRCAGMPDGNYELGGQSIVMRNNRATLLDGTIAGSSSNLHEELKFVTACGVPLESAIAAITSTPAKIIKRDKELGSIGIGKKADLLLLDHDLNIHSVFIEGKAQTPINNN